MIPDVQLNGNDTPSPATSLKPTTSSSHLRMMIGRIVQYNARQAFGMRPLKSFWAISLTLILSGLFLEAQPAAQQPHVVQTNSTAASTNSTVAHATISASHQSDSSPLHESWFFYLSSLAITITAGSALLVALAIVKMQSLAVSLTAIERSLAEAFHRINKLDEYSQTASPHFLNEQWTDYFKAVSSLAKAHHKEFLPQGRPGRYTETKFFVDTLVAQGCKLEERNKVLRTAMMPTFVATAVLAGTAILALPAARWVSLPILIVIWAVTGVLAFILLVYFLRIMNSAFNSK